jgi:hypothetical protein
MGSLSTQTREDVVNDEAPKPWYKKQGFQNAALIIGTLAIAYGLAVFEVVRRAHNAYDRGEALYAKKQYRQAMWEYQECQEFYNPPHTQWIDKSEAREWECRATLGDWVPPEGPLDADVRQMYPQVYAKYQAALSQITPVPDVTYDPMPAITPTVPGKGAKKGAKK